MILKSNRWKERERERKRKRKKEFLSRGVSRKFDIHERIFKVHARENMNV